VEGSFLEQLAQPRPDPGGGAAAAYACSVGVALLEKVIRLETQRKAERLAQYWHKALVEAHRISTILNELREKDSVAYLKLAERRASPTVGDDAESAILEAVACPRETIDTALLALECLSRVGNLCKFHLVSDLQVACELMAASIMGSYHIAAANLCLLRNESTMERRQLDLSARLDSAIKVIDKVRQELILKSLQASRNR
jgi:formiminotetrahydrofolate cyclodeaminase